MVVEEDETVLLRNVALAKSMATTDVSDDSSLKEGSGLNCRWDARTEDWEKET